MAVRVGTYSEDNLLLNSAGTYSIGDIAGAGNGTKMEINDLNSAVQFTGNVGIGVTPTVLFQVQSGGNDFLSIDPTAGAENALLRAYNTTDNDNTASIRGQTSNIQSEFRLSADFNDGTNEALIIGLANNSSKTISYSADTHTFTGDTFLHRSGTALDNGAAAAAGTLLNAPIAGDPTKWVPIDDNGTTRYIPAW